MAKGDHPLKHPGVLVGEFLRKSGVSVRAASTELGVSHNALANLVRGDAGISPDMSVRLGAYTGESDETWLRMQMQYDLWHARHRLKVAAAEIMPAPKPPAE